VYVRVLLTSTFWAAARINRGYVKL